MRILRYFVVVLLILLSLLVASSAWFIYTQTGTRLLFKLAQHVVPQLSIQNVSGDLAHLTLKGVRYQESGITLNLGEVMLNSQLSALLKGELNVKHLQLDQVQVNVDSVLLPHGTESASSGNVKIALPISVMVHQLELSQVNITVDNNKIKIAHFDTQLGWSGSDITLIKPTLTQTMLYFSPTTAPKLTSENEETKHVSTVSVQQKITSYIQQIQQQLKQPIVLPDVILPLNINISQFKALNTQIVGEAPVTIKQLTFSLNAHQSSVTLSDFSLDSSLGVLSLKGQLSLCAGWSIQLDGNGELYQPTPQSVLLNIQGNIYDGLQATVSSTGQANLQLLVKLALHNRQAPLLLQLESSGLRWPLTGTKKFSIEQSKLSLVGTLEHYTVSANMQLKVTQLPDLHLQLQGTGTATQFDLSTLSLAFKNAGKIAFSGLLDWQKSLTLDTTIKIDKFNLQHIVPSLNSQLDGGLQLHFTALENSWQIALNKMVLTGEFNGQALKLSGALSGSSLNCWQFNPVFIELGANQVTLKGEYRQDSDLSLEIHAPDLSHILPHLQGSVMGSVSFKGSLNYPQVLGNISLTHFIWQDLSIAQLQLKSDISGRKQLQGKFSLAIRQLSDGDKINVNSVALNVAGTELQHQIKLLINGQPVGTVMQAVGHFNRTKSFWQIDFTQSTLRLNTGHWKLQQPMELSYDFNTHQVTLSKQCWLSKMGRICLPTKAMLTPQKGHLAIQLTQLHLNMLNPWLTANNIALAGEVSARGDFSWNTLNQQIQPKIQFDIKTDHVAVTDLITDQVIPVIKNTELHLLLNSDLAKINLGLNLPKQGVVNANLLIKDPLKQGDISGTLSVNSLDLAQFQLFLQHSDKFSGHIDANLKFSGSLKTPQIFGNLSANQLILQDKKLPLQLTNGDIQLKFLGQKSTLNSNFQFEQGQLKLQGKSDWSNSNNPQAQLSAVGQNIQVNIPLYGNVIVSPNIDMKATTQHIRVKGKVNIPEANIKIKSLPSSVVDVSDDQVLVDSNLQPITQKKKAIALDGQVEINIGPKVLFSGFGLTTGLNGTMMLLLNAGNVALHGNVFLNNGKYQAYGQNLVIRKGQLTFSGPVSATTLNIEAIRNPDAIRNNVTAGLKVTGSIQHPRVALFSQPALPQQQILSYLLRGQSLENGDNSSLATTLLLSLGSSTGTNILKKLASPLGIKDLSIDSKGSGQQSQVVVSGYILPKLKVEYGVGLFDSLATLTVRYQLLSQLYIEAKSGLNQAIELLYQFSFN